MRPDQVNLVMYHGPSCPDGFGARCAAEMLLGSKAEYVPCSHGDKAIPDVAGKYVAILDFSFPAHILDAMIWVAKGLIVIDHHYTAEKDLANIPEQHKIFDMHQSGAVLAWKYFFPGQQVPLLLRYVQDRDLWNWALPDSMEICAGLDIDPVSTERWFLMMRDESKVMALKEPGAIIFAYRNKLIDGIICKSVERTICGIPTRVVNANSPELISYLGHRMLETFPSVGMAMIYYQEPDKKRYAVSLRSRAGMDCSTVAKRFGGGGHQQSCGFALEHPYVFADDDRFSASFRI